MTLKCDAKFDEKLTRGFENDMRNLADFHQTHLKLVLPKIDEEFGKSSPGHFKVSKICTLMGCFWLVLSKITRNLANFYQSMFESLKFGTLSNFDPSTRKSQKVVLYTLLLTKVYNVWAKKSTEKLYLMGLKIDAKFEGKLTCAF